MNQSEQIQIPDFNFWESWENITPIESKAIEAVKHARDLIIATVPKENLIAIYIKGSFVRREMKEGSDVDMVPIVRNNEDEDAVFALNGSAIEPVAAIPLSLWEFEHNQLATPTDIQPDLRAKPDRMLAKLNECQIIYGTPLNPAEFPQRDLEQTIQDEIKVILNGYIPAWENKQIDFKTLIKEFFWLVSMQQENRGELPTHSFEQIAARESSDHLIQTALKYRKENFIDNESLFVDELKKYLNQ